MGAHASIDAEMSVREILRQFPATRTVFDQYGLFGCGGEEGPPEPLSLFARVHQANLDDLLEQLRRAAGGEPLAVPMTERAQPVAASVESAEPARRDPRTLSRTFLRTALVAMLTGGSSLGAVLLALVSYYGTFEMALSWPGWITAVQIHAHIQLSGWLALFIMGIAYFALPRFLAVELTEMRAARLSFALLLGGILLRSFYQPFSAERWAANWVFWGTAAEFVASLLFLRIVLGTVRSSPKRAELYTRFLGWGSGWFLVSQGILLAHAAVALVRGQAVLLSHAVDDAYLHTTLMGFVGLFILGVTLRSLPLLLDFKRQASPQWLRRILASWNFGVALFVLAPLLSGLGLGSHHGWTFGGACLELLAGMAFLATVNPFQAPHAPVSEESPSAWLWLVRAAYVWFAVALALQAVLTFWTLASSVELAHAYWGAFRHALTVGWISMMIFGMAYRMVPVMEGRAAAMAWTAPVIFWLLNLGNLGRVSLQSLTPTTPAAFPWMAPAGALGWAAGVLFAFSMWKTMSRARIAQPAGSSQEARKKLTIGPDTVVAEVLDAYPGSLEVFFQHGFTALKNPVLRATAARVVTLAQACRMHSLDLDSLLGGLTALADTPSQAKSDAISLVHLTPATPALPTDHSKEKEANVNTPDKPDPEEEQRKTVEQMAWSVLDRIEDPEIPGVSIVDLGFIYELRVPTAREVLVRMTLTTRGCPMGQAITEVVRKRIEYETGADCEVELVWEPPWTPDRITDRGKQLMGMPATPPPPTTR